MSQGIEDLSVNGRPARLLYADLLDASHRTAELGPSAEWAIGAFDGDASYQIRILMERGTVDVHELWVLRFEDGHSSEVLHVREGAAKQLVELFQSEAFASLAEEGSQAPSFEVLPGVGSVTAAYNADPDVIRSLIESDTSAEDVVAVARRRAVIDQFARMMNDNDFFDALVEEHPKKSKEGVWQSFFEENQWIFGIGLSGHLLLGWDSEQLEKIVVGAGLGVPGKRADAVLKTAGVVGMIAFAEIKHHRTELLAKDTYRSGAWAPSKELAGAVAQSQTTVQLAVEKLSITVEATTDEGFAIPELATHVYRPRSFVVAGSTAEFVDGATGGRSEGKIRSFELFRRNLYEPDVLTFDELLARAKASI